MTPEQVEQAAGALAAARTGQAIPGLPNSGRPQSEADSYAIQDAVVRKLGERVGGWKVGFSPEGGIFCAPIYASKVHASPASLPAEGFHVIAIECEIGFRINQALSARAAPYSRDEVLAAASLHPTIEVVDSRYQDFRSLDRLQVLADNFSNGALVYGAAFALNFGLCLALIPWFGATGAAIASASAIIGETALLFVATKVRLGLYGFVWGASRFGLGTVKAR